MRRVYWYLAGRFCEVRRDRAFQKYLAFRGAAEKFFNKIEGGR
ncbi:hypothetical protein LOKVESSMR4R_03725 [Yoonia vestfoldensis]|uniref:Uncharacterized protein n=1 Tax=Yoonia vestfoldensis TaxID=245188 RepID=A0A1Y0EHX8_9RHOB|nr:hypothetical protein LOKVESSMR4R_03725 [Yoonia vestfoldensis]